MCEPTTIITAVGLAMSAYSSYQQAQSQKESLNYQSAVARNNAQLSEWQAQDSIRRGQEEEQRQRMMTAQLKGKQRVGFAASGIDISEGSAAQIQADTDWMGEQDALTIRDNANREAWGLRNQSQQYKADSVANKAIASSINPLMAAGGGLLTGLGSATNKTTSKDKEGTILTNGKSVSDKWYSMSESFNKTNKTDSFTNIWPDNWSQFSYE